MEDPKIERLSTVIFSEPWWLNTVAPGLWGEVVVERGNRTMARMPYVIKKCMGFKCLTMPPLTQTLGPTLRPYPGKYVNQLSEEKQLMMELIEQLPSFDMFEQNFHYSVLNWLPFYWNGFSQTTRYTYVIENLTNLDNVWNNMASSLRNKIRKAKKLGIVVEDTDDIETLLSLRNMTFQRQGITPSASDDFVRKLNESCVKQGKRKIYIAYGKDGQPHTGLFCVYNNLATYNLIQGGNPDLRNSGANTLAMWESIRFASQVSQVYDFEGSMIEPVEEFFRSFGAIQKPYFRITKVNNPLIGLIVSGRDWWRRNRMTHADAWWLKAAVAGLEWWRAKRRK